MTMRRPTPPRPAPGARRAGVWLGLALLLAGLVLGLFPLLPATTSGGGAMRQVPHLPGWVTGALVGLGIGILLAARRQS